MANRFLSFFQKLRRRDAAGTPAPKETDAAPSRRPHLSAPHGLKEIICRLLGLCSSVLSIASSVMVMLAALLVFTLYLAGANYTSELQKVLGLAEDRIEERPDVKPQVLYLMLSGRISEYPVEASSGGFGSLVKRLGNKLNRTEGHDINAIERALRQAAADDDIKEVLINLSDLYPVPIHVADRISRAIDAYKAAGKQKKVTVMATYFSQTDYLIATHASWVILDPLGEVMFSGIGVDNLYYRDFFTHFGITPYIFRAGRYKKAVEPYESSGMSDHVRAENVHILSELWKSYLKKISNRHEIFDKPDRVLPEMNTYLRQIREAHGDLAALQLRHQLIDEVKPLNTVLDDYAKRYGTVKPDSLLPKMIEYRDYLRFYGEEESSGEQQIAVVYGLGNISEDDNTQDLFTPANLSRQLDPLCLDKDIKAVVLYLNSPGGSVNASEAIRRSVQQLRDHGKKVVISMNGLAASGAYYVATASDWIVATDMCLIGSIGVYAISISPHRMLNNLGIKGDMVQTHPLSNSSYALPSDPQILEMRQLLVEDSYRKFVDLVAAARHIPAERENEFGQGRIFLPQEAKRQHLIDEIGSLDDALLKAQELCGLKEEETHVRYVSPRENTSLNFMQALRGLFTQALMDGLPQGIREELKSWSDPVTGLFPGSKSAQVKHRSTEILAIAPLHSVIF